MENWPVWFEITPLLVPSIETFTLGNKLLFISVMVPTICWDKQVPFKPIINKKNKKYLYISKTKIYYNYNLKQEKL